MTWAAVTSELIIGPYFFDVSVISESYPELLFHWLIPELVNVGLLNSLILQQDRTPSHYAADVHAFLNNWFPPLMWPPRSPDLTTHV
jgi:hypothetical protein